MSDDHNKQKSILDKLAEEVDKISERGEKKSYSADVALERGEKLAGVTEPSMLSLLEKSNIDVPQVGDVIEGTVIYISTNSIYLDLGPFGTGVVVGKEIKDGLNAGVKIKKGDRVSATVTELENEDGYIELSIREASYEKAWDDLESKKDLKEIISTRILDANKGGLLVEINGINGFLPVSQLSSEHYPRVEDGDKNKILEMLKKLVGQELNVRIIDTDKATEKLIVSEKAAMSEKEKEIISELKVGDIISGEVSGVVDFGAFVKFLPPSKQDSNEEKDKLEGLVHISELAWQLIDDPREIVKTGDKIKAKIIGIDDTRISLSMKALAKDPWLEIGNKYHVGDIVTGKVDKINPFGAFVYLDENIHGLAHISEFREIFPDKKIGEVIKEGESYKWKILSIEPKDHRMGLVLVQDDKEHGTKSEEK